MARRKRSKRWLYWMLILVLILIAGVIGYLVWDNYFKDKEVGDIERTETVIQEESIEGVEKEETGEKKTGDSGDDEKKVKQYEGDDPNSANTLSGVITYSGMIDNKLIIRVNIDQFLNTGSCRLSLINGGIEVYSETADIIDSASTSTCEGFDVVGLESGKYNIVINLESNNRIGVISGEVNVE